MKARHYYYFGHDLQSRMQSKCLDSTNWDMVRTTEQYSPFSFEKTIDEYDQNCLRSIHYKKVAMLICGLLSEIHCQKVVSMGVGKGILEWHIKKLHPDICVECTDYTPESISLLSKLFVNADNIFIFDMLNDDYSSIEKNSCLILYRVSTEFSYNQWCAIFNKIYSGHIKYVIFTPSELLRWRSFLGEKYLHIKHLLLYGSDVFCGWMYSEIEFLKIFKGNDRQKKQYFVLKKVNYGDTAIYLLERCE